MAELAVVRSANGRLVGAEYQLAMVDDWLAKLAAKGNVMLTLPATFLPLVNHVYVVTIYVNEADKFPSLDLSGFDEVVTTGYMRDYCRLHKRWVSLDFSVWRR